VDVLVDYDNLLEEHKRQGLPAIAEAICAAIGVAALRDDPRLRLRLYDGFYEERALTRRAQQIAADAAAHFPSVVRHKDGAHDILVRTSMEPAYSLIADPAKHLWYTFRPKGPAANLRCRPAASVGCTDSGCPMSVVFNVFRRGRCTQPSCTLPSKDLIHQPQQKLIDTMLTADLICLAQRENRLAIVSSDDDVWPGIQAACAMGATVFHVHTRDRTTPGYYAAHVGASYHESKL
jgi:hypothetical protein